MRSRAEFRRTRLARLAVWAPGVAAAALALAAVALVAVGVAGCAGGQKKATASAPSVARAPAVRLVWLPVEPLASPEVAAAVNAHLGQVKVPGVTAGFRAAVSLEVAQLAIECIEPTPACWAKVGRSLGGDRMLWAEIEREPAPAESVRVALVLFDVAAGEPPKRVEHAFDTPAAARDGVAALFEHAFDAPAAAASAAPAAKAPAAVAEGRAP